MGFFSKKKIELTPQWQKDLQQELAKGEGYGGKMTAEMSPYEKTGLEQWLAPFLEAPATGKSFAAGEEELGKVLRGEYDPRTSPYYTGLKTEAMTNLEEVIDQIRGQKAAGGEFFTSERIGEEQKAGRDVAQNLNTMLGQMFEQERARTFAALPLAMQYDEYAQTTAPMAKMTAASTFGALPRQIEQADLERKYQDFVNTKQRQLTMAGLSPGVTQPYEYGQSKFEEYGTPTAKVVGTLINAIITGGAGSAAGATGAAGGAGGGFASAEQAISSRPGGAFGLQKAGGGYF